MIKAEYDELTGLANRTMFNRYLEIALARAERSEQSLALMFIDLDDFKAVNDTLGHVAGDGLLRQVAHRLKTCLRAGDHVSRLGGDEFTVVLENCNLDHLRDLAGNIVSVISAPMDLDGLSATVSASIGIATYPRSATTHLDLIRAADAAMYDAKGSGKNGFRIASEARPRPAGPGCGADERTRTSTPHGART
jgi:diguanylate cyclase (GGDEF)-like protein